MSEASFTKKDFAAIFEISLPAVDKWVEQGIPRVPVGKNRYRYGARALKWAIKKRSSKNGKKPNVAEQTATVELERAKIKLDRERGQVVPISTFKDVLDDVATRLDSKLQAMARKWGAELLGIEELPAMVSKLDEAIEECRAELRSVCDD